MSFPAVRLPPPDPPRTNRNLFGILLMALGFFGYSISDTIAKVLAQDLSPVQVAWTRQLGLLTVAAWFLSRHGTAIFRSQQRGLQIARGVIAGISPIAFITALTFVPIADAVAVTFVSPFIVTILAALLLGEAVGPRRWAAIGIGFLGMLIVLRPGLGVVHPAMLLVLVAAAAFAARQILSRQLSQTESTATTVTYTALGSLGVLTLPLPFFWEVPATWTQIALLAGLAFSAGLGELLVIRALELTTAVVLAPLHYSLILWGTTFGWLVFDQLPDFWTVTGAAIIVATGLYTIHRERLAHRRR